MRRKTTRLLRWIHTPGAVVGRYAENDKDRAGLMSDIDMFQFIERGMRGGISSITHWYGKANNKQMQNYVEKLVTKYMYLDANNLYGWAINSLDVTKYHEDSKEGLILEVHLDHPRELHDLHAQ